MGRRGPQPTPTSVLKLRGSRIRRRDAEPQASPGAPTMPTWLDAEGKRCWRRIVKSLSEMGVLAKTDREVLTGLVQFWSLFVRTSKWLNEFKTVADVLEARRLAAISDEAFRNYLRACVEFGLTPSSRARVKTAAPEANKEAHGKGRFFKVS